MPVLLLNSNVVKNALCPEGKVKYDLFDSKCKGLMVEVRFTGGKTYYLRFQDERGKSRQFKIADARDITISQARQLADKYRSEIALGGDPFAKRKILKQIPTIEEFVKDTYIPFIKTYKKSWATDVALLKNYVLPNFGKLHLDQFNKKHLIDLISKHLQTHKPGSVNRLIILIRYIFNCALRWETPGIEKNPTAGIQLLEENNKMERYLTAEEAKILIQALKNSKNKMLQYIVSMLILTGARKQEVLKAKWEDFNIENRIWRIPTSKSGKARHVPISDGVLALLDSIPLTNSEWVFANPKTKKPYLSVFSAWDSIRKSVGLSDVRMHDLRHSFASFLINSGRSLYEVQKILGHTQISTTQRYAHLSQQSLISAANEMSKILPFESPISKGPHEVKLLNINSP